MTHHSLSLTRQEKGIVLVSGWVLLGLEQGVKVPERAFYEIVGWHLSEATEKREVNLLFLFSRLFIYLF